MKHSGEAAFIPFRINSLPVSRLSPRAVYGYLLSECSAGPALPVYVPLVDGEIALGSYMYRYTVFVLLGIYLYIYVCIDVYVYI